MEKQVLTQESFLRTWLIATLLVTAGILVALFNPVLAFPLFGMALMRGGFSKWLAYIATGLVIGPLIGLVSSLTISVTSFLPGILGQVAGWILLGWIIILVVGMILRFTGARGK